MKPWQCVPGSAIWQYGLRMATLFDQSPTFDRVAFRERLAALARRRVLVGTSSWKYPGWLDQIYSPFRYATRGRFSKKRFEAECITEYAETFPTVCGDFAFYQFPSEAFWETLFSRVPQQFVFSLKVPEQITRVEFARLARYGAQSGQSNPSFLDTELMKSEFLKPLERHRTNLAVLILEFGSFPAEHIRPVGRFVEALDHFLRSMPRDFRFGVEVRNAELLVPEYFACLRANHVAHVFNCWTRMPDPSAQMSLPESTSADFVVCRALLRPGRSYELAVKKFEPYTDLKDPYEPARQAIRNLIGSQVDREVYIYVNNRLEGNAPLTIEAILGG